MTLPKLALLALSLVNFASFIWGVRGVFHRTQGNKHVLRMLEVVVLSTMAAHLWTLFEAPSLSLGLALTSGFFLLGALALFFWASRTARRYSFVSAFCPDSPRYLVTQGPFAWVRHPFYASYLLTYVAGWTATLDLRLLPFLAATTVVYLLAIRVEEQRFLSSPFRQAYEAYRRQTGMLLPRFSLGLPATSSSPLLPRVRLNETAKSQG